MEELSLPVTELREVHRSEAEGIVFHFVEGTASAEPCLTEHEAMAFVRPREMLRYAFCPADEPVARALALNDPPLRHFFWDFDGTVMDTYPVGVEAFRRAASALGAQLEAAEVLDLMKRSVPACLREVSAAHGLDRDMLERLFRAEEARVPVSASAPVAGIPETLRALREAGGHHYLVTHRDRRAVSYLQNAGLDGLFDDLVTAEDGFPPQAPAGQPAAPCAQARAGPGGMRNDRRPAHRHRRRAKRGDAVLPAGRGRPLSGRPLRASHGAGGQAFRAAVPGSHPVMQGFPAPVRCDR